jgi:hypothetical protein
MRKDPKPIIKDQYTAAQAYFICVVGLLVIESLFVLPSYLIKLIRRGRPPQKSTSTYPYP